MRCSKPLKEKENPLLQILMMKKCLLLLGALFLQKLTLDRSGMITAKMIALHLAWAVGFRSCTRNAPLLLMILVLTSMTIFASKFYIVNPFFYIYNQNLQAQSCI